MHARCHFPFRR